MLPVLNTCRIQGFTLVEILVSMVILAIGLLGLASLQTLSLKDNQDAYLYSQASALAYDMSDRIRANQDGWIGAIPAPNVGNGCNSPANPCTDDQMAAYDYFIWNDTAKKTLIGNDSITVSATVVPSVGSGSANCTSTSARARCIKLSWASGHQTESQFILEVLL
jgi:type IV pilus assembly protein PilV